MKLKAYEKVNCCNQIMVISRIIYCGNIDNIEAVILYDGLKEYRILAKDIENKISKN